MISAKFPFSLVIEETTETKPILLELHELQNDSSSIAASTSVATATSLVTSTVTIRSRSLFRDERESMKGMFSRSTFDEQGSFMAPNINTYLFDIEMNIEQIFSGPKTCHLMVCVHGLLGNF